MNLKPNISLVLCSFVLAMISLGADPSSAMLRTVKRGNDAWIKAGRTLDSRLIQPFFADEALAALDATIASARKDGVYMDLDLVHVYYRSMKLSQDHKNGSVDVSEYWRITWRRISTNECDVVLKPLERRQTYFLKATDQGWRIVRIVEEPNSRKIETESCSS